MRLKDVVLVLAMAGPVAVPAAEPAPKPIEPPVAIEFPVAIEKVWFKTPGRLLSRGGDLIVTETGLEFIFGKRNLSFSMDEIYILSLGKLKGDVDTDWALVGLGRDGPSEIIGVRDGKKLGYGGRTEEIHALLLAALRQARAGQYDVPEGYRAFDAIPRDGSLAIPEGWSSYADELILDREGRSRGTIVFSEAKIVGPTPSADGLAPPTDDPTLHRVMAGESPAFFLARRPIGEGMSCDEIAPKPLARLLESGGYDPLARIGYAIEQGPAATPARVGYCAGQLVRSQSRRPDGKAVLVDAYVGANRDTLFVIGIHALEEHHEAFRKTLDTALSTLRFSVSQ